MAKIVDLYIDGYIGKDMGQSIFGGESSFGLSSLNTFLGGLDADVTDINVRINSGGGSVDEGFAIYDKLSTSPYNITTIAEGMVGSIATVIYMAGTTRKMFENSKFFIHNPYFVPSGPDAIESKDAQKLADELKAEEDRIINFYSEKTGKSVDILKPFMDSQTSFSSSEAIEMGFATEVVKKDIKNNKVYKLVAFKNTIKKDNDMTNPMTKAEQITWFQKIENMFKGFKAEIVNKTITTTDGKALYIQGDFVEGAGVFSDEAMTIALEDGDYVTEAETIVVKEGKIVTITAIEAAVVDPSLAELTSANEALALEVETLKASIEANKIESQLIADLQVEILAFKKMVVGETKLPTPAKQTFKAAAPEAPDRWASTKSNLNKKYGKK